MNSGLSQSALCRLLVLSNRAYDLDIQLRNMHLPGGYSDLWEPAMFTPGPLADLQDEIDQTVRAGLVTCWLADTPEPED
ncbi:MAG: hypothetical protein IIC99_00135 [Chloroflexi bacterium]|nr:hypothetical protein [Chloroflexota bacterium]